MGYVEINDGKPISWERFIKLAQEDIHQARTEAEGRESKIHYPWLFRGQANKKWLLETTLERYYNELKKSVDFIDVADYYITISKTTPAVNSLSSKKFEEFSVSDLEINTENPFRHLEKLEQLCYYRHLGFPSPLLDWSLSYYVAAFFAFNDAKLDTDPAIFSIQERNSAWWVEASKIDVIDPYIETHPRHYMQQSRYTHCMKRENGRYKFVPHVRGKNESAENQTVKKYVLKATEREKVLKELYLMNINDYTLFGDDESLMRTLAYKEFRNL